MHLTRDSTRGIYNEESGWHVQEVTKWYTVHRQFYDRPKFTKQAKWRAKHGEPLGLQ